MNPDEQKALLAVHYVLVNIRALCSQEIVTAADIAHIWKWADLAHEIPAEIARGQALEAFELRAIEPIARYL